jgi:ribosome-associated protein
MIIGCLIFLFYLILFCQIFLTFMPDILSKNKYVYLHMNKPVSERDFASEFVFRTSRSSGNGGQNVNKVSTRVELLFFIDASAELDDDEKILLLKRLRSRIRKDGALHLVCQEGRSQVVNKKKVIERFFKLIETAMKPLKERIPTMAGKEVEEKRRQSKIMLSRKKELRHKPGVRE